MRAKDYRAIGRAALGGHWGLSIGVTLVAVLLGASVTGTGALGNGGSSAAGSQSGNGDSAWDALYSYAPWLLGYLGFMAAVLAVYCVVILLLGGASTLGLRKYNIDLVSRREPARFGTLFSRFAYFGRALVMQILVSLFSFLWAIPCMLPSVIVGVLATFSLAAGSLNGVGLAFLALALFLVGGFLTWYLIMRYSMASYVMAENPQTGAMESIRQSRELMRGHVARLFFLNVSFIGWVLLCMLTLGIGFLWLSPYMAASEAAFYLDLTGRLRGPAPGVEGEETQV